MAMQLPLAGASGDSAPPVGAYASGFEPAAFDVKSPADFGETVVAVVAMDVMGKAGTGIAAAVGAERLAAAEGTKLLGDDSLEAFFVAFDAAELETVAVAAAAAGDSEAQLPGGRARETAIHAAKSAETEPEGDKRPGAEAGRDIAWGFPRPLPSVVEVQHFGRVVHAEDSLPGYGERHSYSRLAAIAAFFVVAAAAASIYSVAGSCAAAVGVVDVVDDADGAAAGVAARLGRNHIDAVAPLQKICYRRHDASLHHCPAQAQSGSSDGAHDAVAVAASVAESTGRLAAAARQTGAVAASCSKAPAARHRTPDGSAGVAVGPEASTDPAAAGTAADVDAAAQSIAVGTEGQGTMVVVPRTWSQGMSCRWVHQIRRRHPHRVYVVEAIVGEWGMPCPLWPFRLKSSPCPLSVSSRARG